MRLASRRRLGHGGFTLVEMVFSAAIISAIVLLMGESIVTLSRTHAFNRAQVRITDVSDSLAQIIGRDVTTSVRVFGKDTDSSAYYASLDLGGLQPVSGSRLPAFTNVGYFEKDRATAPLTGNLLFLGTRGDPMSVSISSLGARETFRVDVLRLVVYLPVPIRGGPYHDFARWCSVPLARVSDVTAITDATKQKKVWSELHASGVAYAWNPSLSRASGLFAISTSGTVSLLATSAKVPTDKALTRKSLAASRRVGISANVSLPQATVPFYANPIAGKDFPGGFEVRVDGPTSGRLVMVRLMLTSVTEHGLRNYAEVRRLLSCHDG